MTRPSDSYTALLVVLGPGLFACALMAVTEAGGGLFLLDGLVTGYAVALLAFLPGLPLLAGCVIRAVPRDGPSRPGWLLLAPLAQVWHVVLFDGCCRCWGGGSPVDWPLVVRYAGALSLTAAASWKVIVRSAASRTRTRPTDAAVTRQA
jgi:hypothetical protein